MPAARKSSRPISGRSWRVCCAKVHNVRARPETRTFYMDPADPHNLHDTADKPVWERIDIATAGNDCNECVRALREPLMKIEGVKRSNRRSENGECVGNVRRAQNARAGAARRHFAQRL